MALGADARAVLRLVVWQGMRLVLLGLTLGMLAGYVLKRLLASEYFGPDTWQRQMADQLYGVNVSDPFTISIIALVLLVASFGACSVPASRAARVDPLVALRQE